MGYLTRVNILYEENRRTARILFGDPVGHQDLRFSKTASTRDVYFRPGSIFALELWRANNYGTATWQVYVLRSVWPGEPAHRVQQVSPGAEILLKARGRNRAMKALDWLRCLRREVDDLAALPPEYFQTAHYNLKNGLEPRPPHDPYGPVQDFLKKRQP